MPSFGHPLLDEFPLGRDGLYLNHGTVGVTPRVVMRERAALLDEMERHPARFMLRELMQLDASTAATAGAGTLRLRAAAERIAAFLGCDGDGLVFVDNATSGICAVLRSLALAPGNEVLVPDHAYGGIARAATFIAHERGAAVRTFRLPAPVASADASRDALVAAVDGAIGPHTRVVVLDHVTSESALVMPIAAMAAACKARGVAVLVDGAHAPGAIPVDVDAYGVDWYVANLHKWAFAPRACGVLWAAPGRRAGLHPTVVSWGVVNDDWLQEFDWTGTRDPTPWLAAPAGIAYMTDRLGVDAMRAWNHDVVWRGAHRLATRWGMAFDVPESMIGCMASVRLPDRYGARDAATAQRLRDALLFEHRIEVPVLARDDSLYVRVSVQVYNDDGDVDRLGEALDALGALG